jgi:hypothetical protein
MQLIEIGVVRRTEEGPDADKGRYRLRRSSAYKHCHAKRHSNNAAFHGCEFTRFQTAITHDCCFLALGSRPVW